jgi:hypothetical protein
MRTTCLIIALTFCWLTFAGAATTYAQESSIAANDPDQLLLWSNGSLAPLTEFELQSVDTFIIRLKYFSGDTLISESELATIGGIPAVISASTSGPKTRDEWHRPNINNLTVIRNPGAPKPRQLLGHDLGWLDYWDPTCELTLKNLKFNIYYPAADSVSIDVQRFTRPAPVIDDQQGRIVFAMHYPPETATEPYGTLNAPIKNNDPPLHTYSLMITAFRDGRNHGGWQMQGLSNYFSTGFAINAADSTINPIPAEGPYILGRHTALDDLEGNLLARAMFIDKAPREGSNVKIGFMSVYFNLPDADEVRFELYEENADQSQGPPVDSVTWKGPTYGTRLLTRRPFVK